MARPRTGAKRTLISAIRSIPDYLRLLFGLFRDPRVSLFDKGLVIAAIAYAISPLDLIPDFIPIIGQADDVFFLLLATQHLIANAGWKAIEEHWPGDPAALSEENLQLTVAAAAFFLPKSIRRRIERRAKRRWLRSHR